jgi:hypothetical protein
MEFDVNLGQLRIGVDNRDYHQLSQVEIGGGKRISQHLSREHGSTRVKDHIEVCDDTPVTPPTGK